MVLHAFALSILKEFKLVVVGSLLNLYSAALKGDCYPAVIIKPRVHCVCLRLRFLQWFPFLLRLEFQ